MLYAANKAVTYRPTVTTLLVFKDTVVADQHWSLRRGASKP